MSAGSRRLLCRSRRGKGHSSAGAVEQEQDHRHERSEEEDRASGSHIVSQDWPVRADSRATHERVVKTYVVTKNDRLYLKHNSLKDDIPIVIALKAMGLTSDKEILQLTCGADERFQEAFGVSLEEAAR